MTTHQNVTMDTIGYKNTDYDAHSDDSDIPVVYVDIPDSDNTENHPSLNRQLFENCRVPNSNENLHENPAATNSGIGTSNALNSNLETVRGSNFERDTDASTTNNFVNTTIFFDQFRNKRIDLNLAQSSRPARPAPPAPLRLRPEPPLDDGFTLHPLALDQPAPPPYSEINYSPQSNLQRNITTQSPYSETNFSPQSSVQRTITTQSPYAVASGGGGYYEHNNCVPPPLPPGAHRRKVLTCQHCGSRVHTVVLKQAGFATHLIAMSFLLLCLFPLTILVYCTNCLKYDNHYCQHCNKLIGYEFPCLCQKLVYVESQRQ